MVSLSFLLALLTIFNVTQSFEYFIDTERCKTDELSCYVRYSCIVPKGSDPPGDSKMLVKLRTYEKLVDNTCDVIVQMKAFSLHRYHVMMQVNMTASDTPSDELDTNSGVRIDQNEPQIICKPNLKKGERGRIVTDEFGKRQIYSKGLIFCSLLVTDENKKITELFPASIYHSHFPTVKFSSISKPDEAIQFINPRDVFWKLEAKCDDYRIVTADTIEGDWLLFEIDKAPIVLTCPDPRHVIRIHHNSRTIFTNSLYCDPEKLKWTYKDGDSLIHIKFGLPVIVHCAIEFSKICAPLSINDCDGCTKPTLTDHKISCEEDKWRMTDGSVVVSRVECKQRGNERTSGWFLKFNDKEITEGACSKEWNCPTYSKLNFSLPASDSRVFRKALKLDNGKEISCPGDDYDLIINSKGDTKAVNAISCNVYFGQYTIDGTKEFVEKGSNVYCKTKHVDEPSSSFSLMGMGRTLGLIALLLLTLTH